MARVDLSLLEIQKIIIHDIPKHKKDDQGITPLYSENESAVTDGMRSFFQDKIKQALTRDQAFKVCHLQEALECEGRTVAKCVNSIIESDEDFVIHSKNIANDLFEIQTGNNAAGILLIVKGRLDANQVCAILKLERDNGAQLVLDQGTRTFNIEEVHNLMLTQKNKIFKVALFTKRDRFGIDYDGYLMDYQINIKTKKSTNTYFLHFLNCVAYLDPKIATKKFYDLTKNFIETIDDPIIRSKYIQDLNSYLQKNQNTINPREFADDYMVDTGHKNNYREYLNSENFEFGTYTKELSLVHSAISKIYIEFENDITILGKDGVLGDRVLLTQDYDTGLCKAEIVSRIKNIK